MNESYIYQRGVEASVTRIWAKTNSATGQWHPLLYHLVETSAVASILWDEILAPSTCKLIAAALGLPLDEARQWSLFLVGAHDLGKASPSFQCKWDPSVLPLKQLGYRFPGNVIPIPHGRVTSIALARILDKRGVEQRVAKEIARAVGGHHGVFDTPSALRQASPQAIGEGLWEESRTWIIDWLAKEHDLSGLPTKHELTGLTLLAGLTTVSDWIASSEEHFPYRPEQLGRPFENLDSLLSESIHKARAALDRLGWRTRLRLPDPLDFRKFFRISNPRPLQVESILISAELNLPSLVIVEAPMGEGKTEAALFVAERLKQRHELRGSFIALPTQATSNQMFGRVVKALSQGAEDGIAHILLLHGHASLSAEFSDLKRKGETGFLPSSVDGGSIEAEAMAGEWFTYRKRGLLAPYGVGTIDQALMAALQSKHVFVRLLGLAGKVVVIDEVHAYDTYMSALLERLLAWLRAIGTSVVMLSATLPSVRRSALVRAFAPQYQASPETPSYPCLTVVNGSQVRTIAFAAAAPGKRIRLEPAPADPAALAVWLHDRIRAGGGCAAVVCNTVARAQEIYEACRLMMPEDAEDGAPLVDLLHSRFPFEEREAREKRTLKRFGKPGEALRPVTAVLVATQIIEQSLDIDFDLMVSELPPIDLLFQRAGRLHRHERERRPTGEMPTLGLIETPLTAGGTPDFPKGHTKVYEEHILLRTWIALRCQSELRIPEDIRSSVEAVYADTDPGDAPQEPALRSLWETTFRKLQASREEHLREADSRYLPHPDSRSGLDTLTAMGRDENDDLHPFFQALTRLAERTVTVVCLFGRTDDLFLDRACTRPLSLAGKVTMACAAEILRRSCSIGDKRVVYRLEDIPVPNSWRTNALLRNCRPLVFDADNCCQVGKQRIRLCPNTGLRVEENPRADVQSGS